MKVFGLTGGIGMGKSTVAGLLRERGIPVVDTDDIARQVVEPGEPAVAEIRAAFGEGVVDPSGRLKRDELARIVFGDESARKQLEAILHPRIRTAWQSQVEQWRKEGRSAAVVVIPLLYETGAQASFDAVLCVACTAATQQRRLQERGWSGEQIAQRNAAQWPIEQKIHAAHRVIWTEGGLETVSRQLEMILR